MSKINQVNLVNQEEKGKVIIKKIIRVTSAYMSCVCRLVIITLGLILKQEALYTIFAFFSGSFSSKFFLSDYLNCNNIFSECTDFEYGCTGCHTGPLVCHAEIEDEDIG